MTSTGSGHRQGSATEIDHDVKIMVNMLFARFHHIYTYRFESAYGDDDTMAHAKREWAFALAGYPLASVERAIDATRDRYSWPPTIAEFLSAMSDVARPTDMPAPRDAYLEAAMHAYRPLDHAWRHPGVYFAAHDTGFFRLRTEPEQRVWPVFRDHYREKILAVARGQHFELPSARELPAPETGPGFDVAGFAEQQGVEVTAIAHLLHYLDLPSGSGVRERLRKRAIDTLKTQGVDVSQLP